jgi:hypothetical protein
MLPEPPMRNHRTISGTVLNCIKQKQVFSLNGTDCETRLYVLGDSGGFKPLSGRIDCICQLQSLGNKLTFSETMPFSAKDYMDKIWL